MIIISYCFIYNTTTIIFTFKIVHFEMLNNIEKNNSRLSNKKHSTQNFNLDYPNNFFSKSLDLSLLDENQNLGIFMNFNLFISTDTRFKL